MTLQTTRSTCPYCGVGCGVLIDTDGHRITGVRGDPDHPANQGRLCTKGATLHLSADPVAARQNRLLQPAWRPRRGQTPQPLGWDAALDLAAQRLGEAWQTHGPDALGLYVSGQLLTEDYYVFNKLAKGLLGCNQIDTNSRLCMSSAVAAYKLTLGADAPPTCYDDVNHAACLFIAGSNTAWAHPVLFRRIEEARRQRPGMKVVVVDPRRTETAEFADLHLALQPGTDTLLFHGLLHLMLWEGWIDPGYIEAHTEGFDALKALVREATPARVAQVCGLREQDLHTAARWFAGLEGAAPGARTPTLSLYCQGLNQSRNGTAKNAALINLHLATGQIGRPGAGPFSLTGQPNAMGGREVGGLANLLSAHRDLADPVHRAEIAALWGVPDVPATPGRTAVEMFQAAADGEVKALWIVCTNPAQSMPDQATVRRALQRAEFVLVQEAFATAATCEWADLLLPATTWGEKDGTVTNSERCISRVRPALPAPGAARHDWRIAVDVARRLETRLRPGQPTLFPYETPEAIWCEHRASTRGRDLDITGLSYDTLDRLGPQPWPMPEGQTRGRARLYADARFPTPSGRARFADLAWEPPAEPTDARHPLALLTGRLRDQWHGMTRTGQLGRLFGHTPEPTLNMHPEDLARRRLQDGELVRVHGHRGQLVLPAQTDPSLTPGQVFLAMHWGSEALGGQTPEGAPMHGVNGLTTSAFCPRSRQPELKHSAVRVEAAALPWTLLAMAWLPDEALHRARQGLVRRLADVAFASCVPFGRERGGLMLRAGHVGPPPEDWLLEVERALGLHAPNTLRYVDTRLGQRRAARLHRAQAPADTEATDQATLQAFLVAGDTRSGPWLKALLLDGQPAGALGSRLLMAGPEAPQGAGAALSPEVCTCLQVRQDRIVATLPGLGGGADARLAQLQQRLRCGTQCGSCLPALRRLVAQTPAQTGACEPSAYDPKS